MKRKRIRPTLCSLLLFLTIFIVSCATSEPIVVPESTLPLPSGAISWEEGNDHIGETITVCGPVTHGMSVSIMNACLLNLGSEKAFGIGMKGKDILAKFPEDIIGHYKGKYICVTGEIVKSPMGFPEIKITDPSQIHVMD